MNIDNPPIIITDIQVNPIVPQKNGQVAFLNGKLNNSFGISNLAVYTRPTGGYRLVYHAARLQTGRELHCFFPINKNAGDAMDAAFIGAYEDFINKYR